ncbi:MAG TPA: DoxX family protein [Candidatus Thiothrix moscowensis]|uniref:DoxX family protein n=1 Tax=unclassified Thiothrix TaxID=2636184 RepID=UPI0025D7F36B|nr:MULTISPECIES: DoxX family protein [unclassified Thiothrix]HRJ54263.1 DoxX family protein [Candidatus Thiothrix moscowensis]HRJ94549.1 DoxX family protein [Candidatus Thiothrix moscowensis]
MKPSITLSGFLMGECWPLDWLIKPLTLLGFRIYVAWVFFASGLTKIQSWSSTVYLFEDEYNVPLLSPEIAAYLGTAAELILPVLLALGLLTRPAALALFVFNIVAVISYPYLFTIEGAGGFWQHVFWGAMLWTVFVFGPGKFSLDYLLTGRIQARNRHV